MYASVEALRSSLPSVLTSLIRIVLPVHGRFEGGASFKGDRKENEKVCQGLSSAPPSGTLNSLSGTESMFVEVDAEESDSLR